MKVLLLHAFPLDARMWEPQAAALAGHEVIAPDLYELGGSLEKRARAVLERAGDGELAVAGASMGGYCALALARLAPERLSALLLAGARADADSLERREGRAATIALIRDGGAAALWEDMRPKLFPEDADPALVERARGMTLEQEPDGLVRAVEAIRDRPDSTDVVESLPCPLLVAVGERDPFLAREEAEAIAARAPDGRLEVFDAGHLPSLERPAEFNRALAALLA